MKLHVTIRQYGNSTERAVVRTGACVLSCTKYSFCLKLIVRSLDQLIKLFTLRSRTMPFAKIASPCVTGVISYSNNMRRTVFYATSGVVGLEWVASKDYALLRGNIN